MRFTTTGELRRLDLSTIVDLVPALRAEWADLRFDSDGRVINPLTGEPQVALTLVDGRHRQRGAIYRVRSETPRPEPSDALAEEFGREHVELSGRTASDEEQDAFYARWAGRVDPFGVDVSHQRVTIQADDAHRLAVTVADEAGTWTADVEITHARLPKVSVTGQVDAAAALRAERAPGWVVRLVGRTAEVRLTVDLAALEAGGVLAEANGRVKKARGEANVDVRASLTRWTVTGDASLKTRGPLRRVLLRIASRWIRRSVERATVRFWEGSDAWGAQLDSDVRELQTLIDAEGGAHSFVRRVLWDEEFAESLLQDEP